MRVLAVTHEATYTGAPMNLLHLVTHLRTQVDPKPDVTVLVLRDGPLRHEFERVCDVVVADGGGAASALAFAQQSLLHLGSSRAWKPIAQLRFAPQLRRLGGFDIVYLNSLASVEVVPYLPPARLVVSHVHELEVAFRTSPPHLVTLLKERPDLWIAASSAVQRMLCDEAGLPPDRIALHHEFIDTAAIRNRTVTLREIERRRQQYRIPADAAIVMGAGTIDWRKGPDLFIQVANEVRRRSRDLVHFVWVGGDLRVLDMARLRSDLDRSGADHVHFVGTQPDPWPWFATADVFALTSREDPYPLVALEHAAMGHPIVAYETGGIAELLRPAGAAAAAGICGHLDVGAMAAQIRRLLDSDDLRVRVGEQLRERVVTTHDVTIAAPLLWAKLRESLDARESS